MTKIYARPEPPVAPCPTCGTASTAGSLRIDGGIHIADYRCGHGHIWTTRWLEVA